MAKKKKRTPEQMHRQIQDSLQALPYAIEQHRKEGQRVKAAVLRFVSGPVLKLMNKAFSARRYRGTEGRKLQQTERMRRHLEQRKAAMKHVQSTMQQSQKRKRAR